MNNKHIFYKVPLSFVRRGGRITASQQAAWEKYSNLFLLEVDREILDTSVAKGNLKSPQLIFGNTNSFIVEIGSGMGDALIFAAQNNPEINFLGIEVYRAGLAKTMLAAGKLGLKNLRLIEANAPEVLNNFLPPKSITEIRVFFPDPWHKAKHHKRRLVSKTFATQVCNSLTPNGKIRLATDWEEYAEEMREIFDTHPGFKRNFTGAWDERFVGRPITAFEQKGLNKNRQIRDLSYTKIA